MSTSDQPAVGLIMRSKDEMPHTPAVFAALNNQTYQNFRVYCIDSGSTDGTLDAIRDGEPHELVEIKPEDYVPGRVLNRMVGLTTEPIVVFLNADAIPQSDDWLEKLLVPILADKADATMSKQITRPDAYFIVDYDYRRAYDPKNIKAENADFFSAVACAFRRELWEDEKFYEEGYAEDLVWAARCRAKGARFHLVLDSVVEHSHNYSIPSLTKKKYRHGKVFARLYGQRANWPAQLLACLKECARDILEAVRRGQFATIPYNLHYRITIHRALYRGLRDGSSEEPLPLK